MKAHEIQGRWHNQHGDFYLASDKRVNCLVKGVFPFGQIKQGYIVKSESGVLIHISRCYWLPRLDQLMEMAQERGQRFEKTAQAFFDWTKRSYGRKDQPPGQVFVSLEQLWLGYVMQKKFDKCWYEGDWRKLNA